VLKIHQIEKKFTKLISPFIHPRFQGFSAACVAVAGSREALGTRMPLISICANLFPDSFLASVVTIDMVVKIYTPP
jgi:hypothetical protein